MSVKTPFNKNEIQEFKKRAELLKRTSQNIYTTAVSNTQNLTGSPLVPISYQKTERPSLNRKQQFYSPEYQLQQPKLVTYMTPLKVSNSTASIRSVSTQQTYQYLNSLKQFISQYSGSKQIEIDSRVRPQESDLEQRLYLYCASEFNNKEIQFVDEKTLQIKEFNQSNKLKLIRFFHLQKNILNAWPQLKGIADNLNNRLLVIAGSRQSGKMELFKRCFQLIMHKLASQQSHSKVSIKFVQRVAVEKLQEFSFRVPRNQKKEQSDQITELRVIDIRYSIDDIWEKIDYQIETNSERLKLIHKDKDLLKAHSFDHRLLILEVDENYEFKILITNDLITEQDLENSNDLYFTMKNILKSKVPHFMYFDFPSNASHYLENLEIMNESTQILYSINGDDVRSMVRTLESYEAVEQFLYK